MGENAIFIGLVRTGRCQGGNEANDEAAFQHGLDLTIGPSGWQRATAELGPWSLALTSTLYKTSLLIHNHFTIMYSKPCTESDLNDGVSLYWVLVLHSQKLH